MLKPAWISLGVSLCLCGSVLAQTFDRTTTFKSSEEFIATLKAFPPQKKPNIYSRAFSHEEEFTDEVTVPEKVESVKEIWRDDKYALIFATARPQACVALLIILRQEDGLWSLQDIRRYEATGHGPSIECELTSYDRDGYIPGKGNSPATLTFKRSFGGRGSGETTSWSLLFCNGRLSDYR